MTILEQEIQAVEAEYNELDNELSRGMARLEFLKFSGKKQEAQQLYQELLPKQKRWSELQEVLFPEPDEEDEEYDESECIG